MHAAGVGFAVFNYDDIMKKYEAFVEEWTQAGKPELYFVTLDIEKCYDSVDVKKLKELLHKTELLEKDYYLLNCLQLRRKNNVLDEKEAKREPFKTHFRHKYQRLSVDGGLFPSLGEVVTEEDNDYNFKRSLLIECEPRRKIFKHEVLNPIDYIIGNNYITFNKK